MLVGVKQEGLFLLLYFYRNDLILELASLDCCSSLLLGSQCQLVLHFTGDAVLLCNVLSGDAHVVAVENVPNTVMYHQVNHLDVVHTSAPANLVCIVRCIGHGLSTASHDALVIAGLDDLSCQAHSTHGGCANLVDGHCRSGDRQTCADHDLTADVLTQTALQHAAGDGFVDCSNVNASLLNSSLGSGNAQRNCRNILQALAVGTDRGSLCRTNIHIHLPNSPFSQSKMNNKNNSGETDRYNPPPADIVHDTAAFHNCKFAKMKFSQQKRSIQYILLRDSAETYSFARPISSSRKMRSSISLMVPSSWYAICGTNSI